MQADRNESQGRNMIDSLSGQIFQIEINSFCAVEAEQNSFQKPVLEPREARKSSRHKLSISTPDGKNNNQSKGKVFSGT